MAVIGSREVIRACRTTIADTGRSLNRRVVGYRSLRMDQWDHEAG